MIIDITGVQLIPGNKGVACPGNGLHIKGQGELIECCCDECDYMLCCLDTHTPESCMVCTDRDCPHAKQN